MKRAASILLVLVLMSDSAFARGARDAMPLSAGATWTYSGTVRWTAGTEVHKASIRWKTWVERSVTRRGRTVAIVRGLPFELAWYGPEQQPGYSVVVQDGGVLRIERCDDRATAGEAMKRALRGESTGSEIVKMPAHVGDCTPRQTGPGAAARRYCWHVEREVTTDRGAGWELVHRTAPDHQLLTIVPGVGITKYVFEHHGTVASVDVSLDSFKP